MAAVEVRAPERTLVQAAANGRVRERYVDATMTRAARETRIAWRLEHLDEWRRDLESLAHFDPDYPYDVAHEYDHDWSTDPDYGDEGIGFSEFKEDGALIPSDARPSGLRVHMLDTARNRIGYRASANPTYVFVPQQVEPMGLYTRQGSPVDRVKPDLVVMPAEEDVLGAYDRDPDRTAQLDDPVPELVLEILWKSTATRDLGDKRRLYEALGVAEYLAYDLGGKRGDDSPRELLMYRLADGAYRRVDPDPGLSEPAAAAYRSEVFGAHIRFQSDPRETSERFRRMPEGHRPPPCFQWWDATEARWRDRVTDAEFERQVERKRHAQELRETRTESLEKGEARGRKAGLVEGAAKTAIAALHTFLSGELHPELRDQIANHWREHGPPADVMGRILAVQQTPSGWRSLLLPDEPDSSDAGDRDHTSPTGPK